MDSCIETTDAITAGGACVVLSCYVKTVRQTSHSRDFNYLFREAINISMVMSRVIMNAACWRSFMSPSIPRFDRIQES